MVDQIIRPADLPNRASPNASEKIPVDNGSNVAGATVESIVLAGRPTASQAEAEAGTDAVKAMTPLTSRQGLISQVGVSIASKAQGDKADTAIQPGDIGTAAAEDIEAFATAEQGGKADTAWQPSTVLPSPSLGDWDSGPSYAVNDRVFHGGNYWIAKRANTGVTPTEGDDWTLFLPGVAVADGSIGRAKLSPSLQSAMSWQYATLAALQADTIPVGVDSVRIVERVAGNGGGAFWSRSADEPDVPARAKTQDAGGAWWRLEPENGAAPAEMFGARGGLILDPETRLIFDAYEAAEIAVTDDYLRWVDETVRRFIRAGIWSYVDWGIDSGTDLVEFTPDTDELTDPQELAAEDINMIYGAWAAGKFASGRVVTESELDAALAINAGENTDALKDWVEFCSHGRAIGMLGPKDYPINDTLRPKYYVTIKGVPGISRLYAVASMPYNTPVLQTGDVDDPAYEFNMYGVITDGNYFNRAGGSAGSVTGVASGTTLSIVYTIGGSLKRGKSFDARKHTIDITGSSYNRSGTPGTINPQITQLTTDFSISDYHAEGSGDDLLTAHSCRGITIRDCTLWFSTGGDTNNSNGLEIDDGAEEVNAFNISVMYASCGAQVKAHSDGIPPHDVLIIGLDVYRCNNGFMNWQTDHGGSGFTPNENARNVFVRNAKFRWPLAWITAETVKVGVRSYAYTNVEIEMFVEQMGADADYFNTGASSQGVAGFYNSTGRIELKIGIVGFLTSLFGVNITSSAVGPITIIPDIFNGPLTGVRQATTGAYSLIPHYHIIRTSAGGTTAILGDGSIMTVGTGRSVNYTTGVDV